MVDCNDFEVAVYATRITHRALQPLPCDNNVFNATSLKHILMGFQ